MENIKNKVIDKVAARAILPTAVTEDSDLFADLGFDSLSFVMLIVELERECGVTFDAAEMEACLRVGKLVAALERKIAEAKR